MRSATTFRTERLHRRGRGDPIVLSPDGSTLAAGVKGQGIRLLPLASGEARAVPGKTAEFAPLAWCADGSLLTYQGGEVPARITPVDLSSGK